MDRPCPPLTVCLLLWLRHRGPGTEPVHGPGSPLRHGRPQYPALLPIKWGSRPAALGGVGVRCHVWGAPAAERRAPRTPHCRLRERLFLPDSLLHTGALPRYAAGGILKSAGNQRRQTLLRNPSPLTREPSFRSHDPPRRGPRWGAEGQGRAGGGGTYSLLSHQTPGRRESLSQWGVTQTRPPRTPLAAHPTVSGRSQTHDGGHPSSRGPALLHRPSPRSHCYRDRHTPPPLPDRSSSHGPSPTPSSKTESGAPRAWPGPCTPPVRRCPFKP